MLKFIIKRLLTMIPVLIGISFIIFLIMSLTPGSPAILILGEDASPQEIERLEDEMGLNDNVIIQYINYMKKVILHGDFVISYISKVPVIDDLLGRLPVTVTLAVGSVALLVIIAIPIGAMSAVKQYSIADNVTMLVAMIFCSMPSFLFGLLAILIFSLKLKWLPGMGADTLRHFILPWLTCSSVFIAQLIRMTRSNMLEVIRADYIRTARAKGASERMVIYKHALRNALLPVITIVGIDFGVMMGGAVITENIFSIAGIGTMTVTAIRKKDTPGVMASLLFVAVMISVINLIVDIIYTYVDPRLRSSLK